jgi:hypothetical protein
MPVFGMACISCHGVILMCINYCLTVQHRQNNVCDLVWTLFIESYVSSLFCTLENNFPTDFICVSALIKHDMLQEQQFCRTPSPQSPICPVSNTDQSTSHVYTQGNNSSKYCSIQVFVHIYSVTVYMHCKLHIHIEKKL